MFTTPRIPQLITYPASMVALNMGLVTVVVFACVANAKPLHISLKKGPLAPMSTLRPSIVQHMLRSSNGHADVPITNFLDAQVSYPSVSPPAEPHLRDASCLDIQGHM